MSSFTFPLFSQEWDKWELAKRQTSLEERQVEELGRQTKALEKIASTPSGDSTPVRYFQPDILYTQNSLVADPFWSSGDIEDAIRDAAEVNLLGQERIEDAIRETSSDIEDTIREASSDIEDGIREASEANLLAQGWTATLLQGVRTDLALLQSEFTWGINRLHDCLVHGFNQLVTTLEITNYTLQHPLGTQAAEHKERGKRAYEYGLRFKETERARWMSDSEADLRAALELNGYDFEVWYLLGFVLGYEHGDLEEAQKAFDSARHYAEPVDTKVASRAARQAGATAAAQQDYEAAVSGYEKATSLDPGYTIAKFEFARVLIKGEDPRVTEWACQLLIKSVEQEPKLWALAFTDPTFQRSPTCFEQLDQLQRQLRDEIQQQVSDLRSRFEEAKQNLSLDPSFTESFASQLRTVKDVADSGGYAALRGIVPLSVTLPNTLSGLIRATETLAEQRRQEEEQRRREEEAFVQLRDEIRQHAGDLRSRFEEARRNLPLESSFAETFGITLREVETRVIQAGYAEVLSIEPILNQTRKKLDEESNQAKERLVNKVSSGLAFLMKDLNSQASLSYRGSRSSDLRDEDRLSIEQDAPGAIAFFHTFLKEKRAQLVLKDMASQLEGEISSLCLAEEMLFNKRVHPHTHLLDDAEVQQLRLLSGRNELTSTSLNLHQPRKIRWEKSGWIYSEGTTWLQSYQLRRDVGNRILASTLIRVYNLLKEVG